MAIWSGVISRKGEPAPGVTVNLHNVNTGLLLGTTVTDGSGNYILDTGAVAKSDTYVVALALETQGATESFNDEIAKG